jgi:hypothetical protein
MAKSKYPNRIAITLPAAVVQKIFYYAVLNDVSMNKLMNMAAMEWLDKADKEEKREERRIKREESNVKK